MLGVLERWGYETKWDAFCDLLPLAVPLFIVVAVIAAVVQIAVS